MDIRIHGQLPEPQPVLGHLPDLVLFPADDRFLGQAEIEGTPEFYFHETERPVLTQDQVDLAPPAAEVMGDDVETPVREIFTGQRFAAVADGFPVNHPSRKQLKGLPVDRAGAEFFDARPVQRGWVTFMLVKLISGV